MEKPLIICTTVLVETSPQAMPLASACIVSAIKNDPKTTGHFRVTLQSFSKEDTALNAQRIADQLLKNEIPACICFSVYVWNRLILEEVVRIIKQRAPQVLCIAGGPEMTANPFSAIFDFCIPGAGEEAVPLLIAHELLGADSDTPLQAYIYKKSEMQRAIIHAPSCNPEKLVSPWLDGDIDPSVYGGALWELARGCPYKCAYCYESKGEKKIAYFPEERIEKELEFFAKKNIAQVFVLDPTYNANKKRALHMLQMIKQKAPGMFFYFEGRAELIDRDLAKAFASIPCALQIGLQSAHVDVLKNVHRTLDKQLFIKNIGYLNQSGAIFGFDLIYGLPGDSLSGFRESIDFAIGLYPNNLELFCLSVLPGTDLYDKATELGLTWMREPPYSVLHTPTFNEESIACAEQLAHACNLFYNQGRAVPWFLTVLRPLHAKASVFFADFYAWLTQKEKDAKALDAQCLDHIELEKLQLDFVSYKYMQKNMGVFFAVAQDIIKMNGALSRTQSDGKEQRVQLQYHPDDVMSQYATDIAFFTKNARKHRCTVRIFMTKNGVDWKTV